MHWVVFDLPGGSSGSLPEAVPSNGAPAQGTNSAGNAGWSGPCPPSGTHRYRFTLFALDGALGLAGTPSADEVRRAAEGHVLEQAQLTGTYTRAR